MLLSWILRLLTILVSTRASNAILWSTSPEVGDIITGCVGQDLSVPWSFTTNPDEAVVDVTWFLERNDGRRTIFASRIDGEFISLSRQHVQFVPNAGFRLQNVTVGDTGLYSVHVSTHDGAGHVTTSNRSVVVDVAAPPELAGGQFLARRHVMPVVDDITDTLNVILECGQFTDRGQPPVIVEWTTPSGPVYADLNYQDGFFLLPLQYVESGNYTCSLLDQSPVKRCLASDSPLIGEATIYIDQNVNWTAMEAIQRELIEREDALRHENEELKSQVQTLTQTLQQLEQAINPQYFSSNQTTCVDIQQHNSMSGVHKLFEGNVSVSVYCDQDTDGGGWTVFQRRQEGSVNFFLNWTDYTRGFGDLNGEFWLGLDNLHFLTSSRRYELRVDLQAFNGTRGFASYSGFMIGNSSTNYKIDFDDFLGGNAGDSLTYHKGREFLTPDRDNEYKCASGRHGAWWYDNCFYSNLNGIYRPTATTPHADGIIWLSFAGYDNSLKRTEMKMRPM